MSAEGKIYNVLFICTGNSDRSILAEAILRRDGAAMFRVFSAGSHPSGVAPYAIDLLTNLGYPTDGLRSKSWDEFAGPDAPQMDFVFTVCEDVANEACPDWPGQPKTAHWGIPNPSRAVGNEAERRLAYAQAYGMLNRRISLFINLPIDSLEHIALKDHLAEIGSLPRVA